MTITTHLEDPSGETYGHRGPFAVEYGNNCIPMDPRIPTTKGDVLVITYEDRPPWRIEMPSASPLSMLHLTVTEIE